MAEEKRSRKQQVPRWKLVAVFLADIFLACAILVVGTILAVREYQESKRPILSELKAPEWYTQDFLQINPYSRPGTKREEVLDIVIHYVANPGTTARQNQNYFAGLAEQKGSDATSASSHFIIGLDGEILQLIPLDEVAYANYPRNKDTVSIECCHPDDSGAFTEKTRESLVRLTTWLCGELHLTEKNVLRHYDITGKKCPKYYVEQEDAWKELLQEIKKKRKES